MKYFFTVFLLSIATLGYNQKLDMNLLKDLKPRNIGPAGMSGRVTAIDVVNDSPDIMYVGSASGGVWKSQSGGIHWKPIFNDLTTASIGAIAIQQSNPSVVWVGTGEGNPRNSLNSGDGVYRTLDGGKTWNKMGLEKTENIHRIIIHPDNPNIIYVGAIGSPWGEHPERGVFKSIDGGKTWNKILFVNNLTGVAEMVMDTSNPNKIIVAMWEHKRDPWFFKSGGPGSGIFVTFDGGDTWKKRTDKDGLPEGELGRIGLAIAPSRPNIVYSLIESKKNALYKSEDGGEKWKKINDKEDIGNRPFYYSEIYVDPTNENRVYSIFTNVNVSEDGGKSFSQLMPDYQASNGVHPDHHAWWVHPKNPDFMMDGNDGGLNITRDRGLNWRFVDNLPVGQFYHVAVDNELPYNVYGGLQDNGSWAGPAYVWKTQGIRNHYWQEISFGDGFDVLPDPENSRYGISTSQQGYAGIYDRKTGYNELIRPTYPEKDIILRFNWNTGMARDPFDPKTIYIGSQFIHKSLDGGQTWTIISPDLTSNDPEKQKQADSGGLTIDATGAENYCSVIVIEPSPIKKNLIWAGTDDGNVQITRDGGQNWSNVAKNIAGLPAGAWISQIKASNKNPGEALLVVNDYRRLNKVPYVFRTKDFGLTWERIVDENDVIGYTLSIVEDTEESRLLFLGTEDGLYLSIDAGANWSKWKDVFPTTNVYDMVIHPREQDLVIGTFGRAIWILDDIRPLRALAKDGASIIKQKIKVFNSPTAYVAENQQAAGTRFGGDALYNGDNRPSGAMITYAFDKPKEEKKAEPKETNGKDNKKKKAVVEPEKKDGTVKVNYDSMTMEVFKDTMLIRTLKWKTPEENGLHRTYWKLEEKGIGKMQRKKVEDKDEPKGITVLPGTYKVRITFGNQKDSASVAVEYDPRLNLSDDVIRERYNALKKLEEKGKMGFNAVERMKESIKIIEDFQKKMEDKNKVDYESQIKLCKQNLDSLNALLDVFVGIKDERQGIVRSKIKNISTYYSDAYDYVENALHAPGETENKLIAKFETEISKAFQKVNDYYKTHWLTFKETIEKVNISPFKEYQDLK